MELNISVSLNFGSVLSNFGSILGCRYFVPRLNHERH
jgi:hypothetical protein